MVLHKSLHLGLFLILLLRLSRAEQSEEQNVNSPGQESFVKKQGLASPDIPDQLAIETGIHEQIEQLPGYAKYPPVPVPVPMQGFSGSLVLPLPPQLQEGGFGGVPKKAHPEHNGQIQGQYSQPQPIRQPPPPPPPPNHYQPAQANSFQLHQHHQQHQPGGFSDIKVTKSKEVSELLIAAPGGAQHYSGEQQQRYHHLPPHEQQHLRNQQRPSIFQHGGPPPPPPFRGDQGPPKQLQHPGQNPQESLTQSLLKEFLAKAQGKPPGHHQRYPGPPPPPQGPQTQGFFGVPPNKHNPLHAPPGPHGKPYQGSKEVANELQAEGGEFPGPVVQYGGVLGPNPAGPWPEGPEGPDMAKIVTLDVKCEKNVMRIFIAFDRPFHGVIFSKGHYHNVHCIHLPAGLGHTSANFDISIDSCGTQGNSNSDTAVQGYGAQQSGSGSFFENVIVIQYDPQVQEVWDQARKLRCTWHDQYEKSVTFRPFPVDMLDVVRADFAGDNVGCWMQIQVGKGPWASEVSGLVKIGQTMTMVLAIKDDDNKFDMLVRNCLAHDGQRSPIQLVDQFGCINRPKLMSRFTKIKNFGASASVLSYAHFQAFKFPDSMEVHFQCTIQICRYQCPEQCSQGGAAAEGQAGYGSVGKSGLPAEKDEEGAAGAAGSSPNSRRRRRSVNGTTTDIFGGGDIYEYTTTFKITPAKDEKENVGLNRIITVVSNDDLELLSKGSGVNNGDAEDSVPMIESTISDIVCMSTAGFASMLVILIGCLLIACIVSVVLLLRNPRKF